MVRNYHYAMTRTTTLILLSVIWIPLVRAQINNYGNLRMHSGSQVGIFGNFTNDGSFDSNAGELTIAGGQPQLFDGTNAIQVDQFVVAKSADSLILASELKITGNCDFQSGRIHTSLPDSLIHFVHFQNGATCSSASDASHVNGVVRKTGNQSFVFPVGNGGRFRPVSIGVPGSSSDFYSAFYREISPNSLFPVNSLNPSLHHVSQCEYWGLTRGTGSSNVSVRLSWNTNSCGVSNLCDLRVAYWQGTEWTSYGNGGTTGTTTTGTVVSGTSCTTVSNVGSFGIFTLGSSTSENILPVTLISYTAIPEGRSVYLHWITASEIGSGYFTVHRSQDAASWEFVGNVDAAGNSSQTIQYELIDPMPFFGQSYYRLTQTDLNGTETYSEIRMVELDSFGEDWQCYPNPANELLHIVGVAPTELPVIYDVSGKDCTDQVSIIYRKADTIKLDISALSNGLYLLQGTNGVLRFQKQ